MLIPKHEPFRCQPHLDWIAGHGCLVLVYGRIGRASDGCMGDVVAAHIRLGTDGGSALKPSDYFTVPLCDKHHSEQHRGERSFEVKYRFVGRDYALFYAAASPHCALWKDHLEATCQTT